MSRALMFAERLKRARKAAGFSMDTLAKQAGLSANAIKKYEHGTTMPSSANLLKLAKALGVRSEYSKPYYWKPYFWSRSDCVVTCGGAPLSKTKQYIPIYRARAGLDFHQASLGRRVRPSIVQQFIVT
jgi:DNA-binding XRE family transcriptional regulator